MVAAMTVMSAVQAGVKLYGGVRKAYADGTRARALTLPLPRAPGVGWDSAQAWFTVDPVGKDAAKCHPRVRWLVSQNTLDAEQKAELVEVYLLLYAQHVPLGEGTDSVKGRISRDEIAALLEIRQWADDEPDAPRTALQQVAGTIVNLAVDHFAQTPGAVSLEHPRGRALLAFLNAIDDADFANTAVRDVAGHLLVGVLEGVADSPDLVAGGDFEQEFVRRLSTSLATAAETHLSSATAQEKIAGAQWLQVIAHSLLSAGAETVLSNPVLFLGVKDGAQGALVGRVGRTLADLALAGDGVGIHADRLVSADGLSRIAKSALAVVAEQPGLMRVDNEGLRNVLVALAKDVAQSDGALTADLFPELACLLLEHSAANLEQIWPGDTSDPRGHLLLTATRQLLTALAAPPAAGAWRPKLTRAQVLAIVEALFAEVVDNPRWVIDAAGAESDTAGRVVAAVLGAVKPAHGARLTAETAAAMIRAALLAVAADARLIERLPAGGADGARVALTAIVDAVVSTAFSETASAAVQWQLARSSVVESLVAIALEQIARHGADSAALKALRKALGELVAGKPDVEAFELRLEALLAA